VFGTSIIVEENDGWQKPEAETETTEPGWFGGDTVMIVRLTPTGDQGSVRFYNAEHPANGFRNITATYDFATGEVTVASGEHTAVEEDGTETFHPASAEFKETREIIAQYVELDGLRLLESDVRQAWVWAGMTRAPRGLESKLHRQLTALEKKRKKLELKLGVNQ